MGKYSIKDIEHLTGIKAHTIRIWEKRYGIVSPLRTETNIRTYSDDDLRRLLNISNLNRHGTKISHLAKLSNKEIERKLIAISYYPSDSQTQIDYLIMAMIDLDESKFNEIITRAIESFGFEQTYVKIILNTLVRIGILWQTGSISPAQEHFISNIIRQKIIVSIDSQKFVRAKKQKRFILFLPEGELHELGLLFAAYLIRNRGHDLLYLGQHTPLVSVKEAEKIWPADFLIVSFATSMTDYTLDDYINKVVEAFPDKKILLTGFQLNNYNKKKRANIIVCRDVRNLIRYIDSMN